ncbi:MAG TPA: Flp pilus assembly protein CpaB [Polyangiaceae bacterium]|nr:Flp pilus assembly protein CpaB [Polyangiaceae bacterium]
MASKRIAIALALAAAGAFLVHLYLGKLESEVAGGPKVAVLVAATDLAPGALLGKEQVAAREIPSAYVDRRLIARSDAEKVLGLRVGAPLKAGDALVWSDVGVASGGRELSGLVQEGMRAINLNADRLFDGLLRPGDRVDVLFTSQAGADETATLLQNLLVLAVSGDMGDGSNGGCASNSVVLSVTTEQAQLITHAEQFGKLRLVLRNHADIVLVEGLPTTGRKDVETARERLRWDVARARPAAKTIERVE